MNQAPFLYLNESGQPVTCGDLAFCVMTAGATLRGLDVLLEEVIERCAPDDPDTKMLVVARAAVQRVHHQVYDNLLPTSLSDPVAAAQAGGAS